MYIPDGFSEAQVMAAIDGAVRSLIHNFSFGYYDEDDLYQEGFLYACAALPKFRADNPEGCGLENFLRICVRRKFLNLRRDKLQRNSPPCSNCPFQDGELQCKEFDDRHECPKWAGWYNRNQAKRSLVESCDASKVTHIVPVDADDICSRVSRSELLQRVSEQIPLSLRADYHRLLDGAKLTKQKRETVLEAVREIASEVIDGSEAETW